MEQQFLHMEELYSEWNARINVVSRRDITHLYLHHIVHSLAITQAFQFSDSTTFLDVGTGGGFPGIPLAVALPHCHFTLIDGVGKKVHVASEIAQALALTNVTIAQRRAEEEKGQYDFVLSRAVMPLPALHRLVCKNISPHHHNAQINGIITFKGGDIQAEIAPFRHQAEVIPISTFFSDPWFHKKYIIYLPC